MNQERRRLDVVLDALARLMGLAPGFLMLWVAVAAFLDLPPPNLGRGIAVPMWVSPAQRFWVGSAMFVGGVYWCVTMLRRPGWRERLGDRGPASRPERSWRRRR